MPASVALLRAVNVGGRNTVPMAELRRLFEALGHTNVRTFIQSGNVVFEARGKVLPRNLEVAIGSHFGFDVTVVVRTTTELERVVDANPFTEVDPRRLHVGFLAKRPPAAAVADLDTERFRPEEWAILGREVYLYLPDGAGRAKSPAYLDRRLRVPTTVRNWNTVTKLLALARE